VKKIKIYRFIKLVLEVFLKVILILH